MEAITNISTPLAVPNRTEKLVVLIVYLAGFLQGLTLVSFPASSGVLKQMSMFSDSQYGAIFLPSTVAAIIGAVSGGTLAKRINLRTLLVFALVANGISQLLLGSIVILSAKLAFPAVLLGTACMGFGFGLGAAPLNTLPPLLFPNRRDAAVVALHTALGIGLAVGPVLAGQFVAAHSWVGFPLSLFVLCVLLTVAALIIPFPKFNTPQAGPLTTRRDQQESPLAAPAFWMFVAVVVLYAFAEGIFSNWSVIYLSEEKMIPAMTAAYALSIFWAMIAVGRLLVSALLLRVPARVIWITLPVLMIAVLLSLPLANTAVLGIALFAVAGLACSAFFPLTVGLVSRQFSESVAFVSSMMIAALMSGNGIGSFIFGPLRAHLRLEQLYRLSAIFPALVLIFGLTLLKLQRGSTTQKH